MRVRTSIFGALGLGAVVVAALGAAPAAADGVDSQFGDQGAVRAPLQITSMSAYNSGPASGKLLVAGQDPLSPHDPVLIRLASDGSRDGTLQAGSLASQLGSGPITDVEALPNGGVALAAAGKLAVLKSDGSLDTSFSGDGVYSIPDNPSYAYQRITQVELASAGEYVVGGTANKISCGACTSPFLTRLKSDGSGPDLRFGGNGDGFFHRTPVFDNEEMTALSLVGEGTIYGEGALGYLTSIEDGSGDLVAYGRTNSSGGFWGEGTSPAATASPGPTSSIAPYGPQGLAFIAGVPRDGATIHTNSNIFDGLDPLFPSFGNFNDTNAVPSALGGAPDGQVVELQTYDDILAPAPSNHIGLVRYDSTGNLVGRELLPDNLGLFDALDVIEATNTGEYVASTEGRIIRLKRDGAIAKPPTVRFEGTQPESTIGPDDLQLSLHSDVDGAVYRCEIDRPFAPRDGHDCGSGIHPAGLSPGEHCVYARAYLAPQPRLTYGPLESECVTVKASEPTPPIVLSTSQPGRLQGLVDRGVRARVRCDSGCDLKLQVFVTRALAARIGRSNQLVATGVTTIAAAGGRGTLVARIPQRLANSIAKKSKHPTFTETVTATEPKLDEPLRSIHFQVRAHSAR